MPKNRDYTGLIRTPPSLAWLIRERAILKGEIDRCQRSLDELPLQLARLREQLAALDAVIPRHETKIDPRQIVGIRKKRDPLVAYGSLTREILRFLREANGQPRYTSEIAMHIVRVEGLDLLKIKKSDLFDRIGYRLRKLRAKKVVRSHHDYSLGNRAEGLWELADVDEQQAA